LQQHPPRLSTEAPQGGYFLSIKLPYPKPPLSILDQIALLRARGLVVDDEAKAQHYLRFIGYYRLSGYTRFFCDKTDTKSEKFIPGTSFQSVLDLYVFDRKIRVLLLDALERIEIAIKSEISNTGALQGQGGPFWLKNSANFDHGQHQEIMNLIFERVGSDGSKPGIFHQFIPHFFRTYLEDIPPSWMLMEAFSFGEASRIYKRMKGNLRLPVASSFSVQHDVLESWIHTLSFARNVCAHHARVWNQRLTIKPKIPRIYGGVWPVAAQDRLYILCCIIHHMMERIADGSAWPLRLRELITARPTIVPLAEMGFPDDWESQTFWKF
jgi:abortive infection bacteriophage resistance protein